MFLNCNQIRHHKPPNAYNLIRTFGGCSLQPDTTSYSRLAVRLVGGWRFVMLQPICNQERAIYYIMYIRYTRYRKLEILGVLEAVGPLFLCFIHVMGVYRITEKSGQPGGLYYIYKVSEKVWSDGKGKGDRFL